ncbi:MAG: CHAP domain-containing protein [Ruminococcaceae bacterium]|nr:CHAP domain-containing protein [Oscillospiraceae bacterium]
MRNCKKIVTIFLCLALCFVLVVPSTEIKVSAYSTSHPNTYINTGNQIEDLIGVAMTQVGYHGNSSTGTKYGAWYGMTNAQWCGMFVSWCANQAGIPTNVIHKTARATLYKYSGTYHHKNGYIPQRGDLVLYNAYGSGGYYWPSKDADGTYSLSSHVAIVCSYDATSGKIWVVHGNSTGDKVCYNSIEVSKIAIQAFVTPPYTTGPSAAPEYDYVNGSYVRLRSGAGTEYDILGQYNVGTSVKILGSATSKAGEKWYKVKIIATGIEGYIRSDFITIVNKNEVAEPVKTYSGYINATNVNLRTGAGTSFAVVGMYSTGTNITVLDTSVNSKGEKWYKIQIDGTNTVGYMISDYITVTTENTDNILPTGELVSVTNINQNGYIVTVKAEDDKAISNVLFSTTAGGVTKNVNGDKSGDSLYTASITTSQFASSNESYTTTVTAVDTSGNCEIIATVTINPFTYKPVTVTYNLNGGTGTFSASTGDYFNTVTLASDTPTKNGLVFMGWNTALNGDCQYKAGGTYNFDEDTVLYAVYGDFIVGDVDGDGTVSVSDLAQLKLYLSGSITVVGGGADINGDGKILIDDLANLKLMLAGATA